MAIETLEFDSTDVGEVEEFVSGLYSAMRIGATGESTRARIHRQILGPELEFNDLGYSFDIGYQADPPDRLIICDVLSRTIRRDGDGDQPADTFGPGDQFLISRPGLPYGGLAHATSLRFTLIDPALLGRVSAGVPRAGPGSVRLLDHRPVTKHAQQQLQRTITHVRESLPASADPAHSPLLLSTASQYLAAQVLSTYPNTSSERSDPLDHHDAHPSALARAISFIESNPDQALSLVDIARAACVSPRAIQLAFRRHLATTPMTYLRRVRLDHARQELLLTSAERGTVADVAGRWGFTASSFARQYRTAFGELPSHTLRG